jgi:hypothetical protein
MGIRSRSIFLLVLMGQCALAAPPAVWAIGEGFRVDPLSGRVREEQRLGGNPIPAAFDYTHHNLAWNATTRRITLSAARNEVVACQSTRRRAR